MDEDLDDEEEEDDDQYEDADEDMMIIVEDDNSKRSSSEQGGGDESSEAESFHISSSGNNGVGERTTKQIMSEVRPTPSLYPYVSTPAPAAGATQISAQKAAAASSGLATLEQLYEYAKVTPSPVGPNNREA